MSKYHLWPQNNLQELNVYLSGFRKIGLTERIKDMSCIVRVHGIVGKYEKKMQKVEQERAPGGAEPGENPGFMSQINAVGKGLDKVALMGDKLNTMIKEREAAAQMGDLNEEGELEFVLEEDMETIKIDKTINLQIEAANVRELAPVMEVFLFKGKGKSRELLSVGNIKLDKALSYYYGLEDNPEYKERFINFMKIGQRSGAKDGEEGHHVRPKVPKVNAQNKMNTFGVKYLVELPEPKAGLNQKVMKASFLAVLFYIKNHHKEAFNFKKIFLFDSSKNLYKNKQNFIKKNIKF